jgi:septal ring factor EnvC (AmiA/AmiB activator)
LERRRDENRVGLNELNTACQVFSGLVEEEKLRLKKMSDEYSKLYSDLEHDMTLANWHAEWLENSESFRMNMQEKSSQWYKLLEQIQKLDVELAGLDAQLKGIASQLEMIEQNIAAQDDAKSKLIFLLNNKKETYSEIMGEKDPKEHLKELTEQKDKLSRERVKCRSAYDSANEYLLQTLGQSTTLLQQQQWQEQETMTLRSKLDMWMNRFNANHPPVQFAELERTYRSDTDWYTMRKETMKTTVQMQKVEEIEKSARNALVEWKNNIYAPQTRGTETEDSTRESLKTTLQELQKNGEEIRKQLAQIEARLERHEEAKQRTGIIEEQIQDIAKE